ncbi:MAG: arginine repressor [Lachnospiraceae bacterium]|nr:arginine repressor [Lachnospiraceae bacterium]
MKRDRQEKILKMIDSGSIGTQEELAELLRQAGYRVTQATVSRDIRELNLTKVATPSGGQKYVIMKSNNPHMEEKYIRVLRAGFVSMENAQNLLVIKTVSGMAMAVAAALDELHVEHILGCIAGDDTIMAAVKSEEFIPEVMRNLEEMLHN